MKTFISKLQVQNSGHSRLNNQSKRSMNAEFNDNRTESAVQKKNSYNIQNSSVYPSQMKFIEPEPAQGKFTVQRQSEEEEELLQGKFPVQRQSEEEEELLQGKFPVQRQPEEEEELLQGKFPVQRQPEEDEELLQAKFSVQRQTEQSIQKPENTTGIPSHIKSSMEDSFNTDFSNVNVHPSSTKATDVGALAYTQGSDIHFAPGQFSPDSSAGRQLLGHELAHVVQQRQGRVQPTTEVNGMPVNDNPSLEKEADILGRKG